MSSPIVADLFDLAAVRVSKYDYDTRLERAEIRFKIQSMKTKNYKYYSTVVDVTPDMKNGLGGSVAEVVTATAWNDVYTNNANAIVAFVTAETKTPSAYSSYVVASVLPPSWDTASSLGDYQVGNGLFIQLRARLASTYEVVTGALPAGVDLNALTGELTGTPGTAGTYTFGIDAVGAADSLRTRRQFTLVAADVPTWVTSTFPDSAVGTPLSVQFQATNATSYAVSDGTVPPGLFLSAVGLMSGIPSATGTFSFTVSASLNAPGALGNLSSDRVFTVNIGALPVWQTATTLDDAPLDVAFSRNLNATNAVAYTLFAGALPTGATLSSTGLISGTPTQSGSFIFTVKASSSAASIFSTRAFSIRVEIPPTWVTPGTLPGSAAGAAVSVQVNATLAYSYGVVGGNLPPGLSLSQATGTISGTSTTPGDYAFLIRAYSPAVTIYADRAFSFQVANTPVWVTATLPDAPLSSPYTLQLSASNAVYYAIDSGALPNGMLLSTGGLLSGSPSVTGTFSITVKASSVASAVFVLKTFTLLVEEKPAFVTETPLLEAQVGIAQSRTFDASNTVIYSLASGTLPTGMSVSSTGAFYGTPTAIGSFSFAIKATSPSATIFTNKSFGMIVVGKPAWSTPGTLQNAATGIPLSYTLSASHTVEYALDSGVIPDGVDLFDFGLLEGTPTTPGSYSFTVSAISAGDTIFTDRTFTMIVADTPVWVSPTVVTAATKDVLYSYQFDASATVSYSLVSGSLPTGLTMTSAGLLSGSATTASSNSFVIRATSAAFNVYTERAFTMTVSVKPVWATASALAGIAKDEALSFQFNASATTAYTFVSGTVPPGLTLSGSGVLSGTPTTASNTPYSFVLRATSTAPNVFTDQSFTIYVVVRPVWATPSALADTVLGASQSTQLQASNATGYVVQSGSPTSGCTVSGTGLLSGTTNVSAAFSFVVRANTLAPEVFADRTFTQIVGAYPVWLSDANVDVPLNVAMSRQLSATDGATYTVFSGSLPSGIVLSPTGLLFGTSSSAGLFLVTIRATSIAPALYTDRVFSLQAAFVPIWSTSPLVPDTVLDTAMIPIQMNASSAVSYSIVSGALPAGVTLTTAGVLSGTPSASGTYTFTVRAATSAGTVYSDLTFTFGIYKTPAFVTVARLGDRQRGVAMSVQLVANDVNTFSVVSGLLPTGVALSPTGVLSGTPTVSGDTSFTVRAGTPAATIYDDRTFQLLIVTQPTWVTPATLADINTFSVVNLQLQADEAASYTVAAGTLPTGLSLSLPGILSGTASSAGAFNFTVRAVGVSQAVYADRVFDVRVGTTPAWVTLPGLADVLVNVPLSVQLEATYAANYAATTALPPGLTLNSFGLLTGTPTQNGLGSFTVRASSLAAAFYSDRIFSLLVTATPIWVTAATIPDAQKSVGVSVQLTATGGSSYSVVSGTVPPGLSVSTIGLLSGTPTTDGPYAFSVRAFSASSSIYADRAFSLLIETTPSWVTGLTLPDIARDEVYAKQLLAVDVDNFSLRSGALPTGVTMTAGGLLEGTPTVAGAYSFTVRAESTSSSLYIERTFALFVAVRPVWVTPQIIPPAFPSVPWTLQLDATAAVGGYSLVSVSAALSANTPEGIDASGLLVIPYPLLGVKTFIARATGTSTSIYADREFTTHFTVYPIWTTPPSLVLSSGAGGVSYQLLASDTVTYTLDNGVLPPGTSLSSAGLISGAADASGSWEFDIRAASAVPGFDTVRSFDVVVEKTPVWITPATFADSPTLTDLTVVLTATDGATYAVVTGALPTGVSLVAGTGAFVGQPTVEQTSTFTVRATTALGTLYADRTFTLRTVTIPVWTTENDLLLSSGALGLNTQLSALGAVSYSLETGLLPPGTALSSAGVLSGFPDSAGRWEFTVRATGTLVTFFSLRNFTTYVELPPTWTTLPTLDPLEKGAAESVVLEAVGGDTYSVVTGSLPLGMTLASSGILSGTPTQAGTHTWTVRATTLSGNLSEDQEFSVLVVAVPVWITPASFVVLKGTDFQFDAETTTAYALETGTLPPGLSLDAAGLLTGTLTAAGSFPFSVRATNGLTAFYAIKHFVVTGEVPPVWTGPTDIGAYETLQPGTFQFTATGGATYSVVAGSLPPGMSLSATGLLSGSPTGPAAAESWTVRATTASGGLRTDRVVTALTVAPPAWQTPMAITVLAGTPFQLDATDAYSYTFETGVLPTGLSLTSAGVLTGTLTAAGTFDFTVRAIGAVPAVFDLMDFTATAYLVPVWTTPAALADIATNVPGTVQLLSQHGGVYQVTAGALPAGMTLSTSGELSGTPTTAGNWSFTVSTTDPALVGLVSYRTFSLLTVDVPVWTTNTNLILSAGAGGISVQLSALHAATYSLETGVLPLGTSLGANGMLTGSPTIAGRFDFEVRASNVTPAFYAVRTFSTFVELSPEFITSATLDPLQAGQTYNVQLDATGADTYTVVAGLLPAGMSLTSAGVLTGTPNSAGVKTFTVRAASGSGDIWTDNEFNVLIVASPAWVTSDTITVLSGIPFQFVANYTTSYALETGVLPPDLTLDADGILSGTLTTAGTYVFEIRAEGEDPAVYSLKTFTATAEIGSGWVTTSPLEDAVVSVPLSLQLVATDATDYALFSGTLPPGLTLSPTGLFSGTPTVSGTFSFVVRASTAGGLTADRSFAVDVYDKPVWSTPASIVVVQGVDFQFAATDALLFELTAGTLPPGLSLSDQGLLSGNVVAPGLYNLTISAIGGTVAALTNRAFTVTVEMLPVWLSPATMTSLEINEAASVQLTATYAADYTVTNGTVPDGMSLSATGLLTGTPTTAQSNSWTVRASSPSGDAWTDRTFTLLVVSPPAWTTSTSLVLPGATTISLQLVAQYATAYAVETGVLPNGTTLSASGLLSGSPTVNGTFVFTLRAVGTDPAFYAVRTFTVVVELSPEWVTTSPLTGLERGLFASVPLIANDAASYSVASGAAPAGMTVTAAGFLEGTPTTEGSTDVTVRAISGSGASTEDRTFTVPVYVRPTWVTSATLPAATSGAAYSEFLVATDGESYATTDTLPAGLTLSAAGVLSGTPTTPGSYSFTVLATNDLSATRQFNLTIA
jgi:hypothetical protein